MSRVSLGRIVSTLFVIGAASLLGCATATPEQARRAERECFDEARHEGYRRLEVTGVPYVVGDSVILGIKARRHGDDFSGSCTYHWDRRRAELSFGREGDDRDEEEWLVEKARDACREEAQDRRYTVRGMSDERVKHDRVRLNMDLRRRGDNYFARCHYEQDRADLDIERD